MATLAEILALLPDNTTGDISAADMREVITGVWGETELAVKTVNGLLPDPAGDVDTPAGTVTTVNGVAPDVTGNVNTPNAVLTVNGELPSDIGNVNTPTGTVETVNGVAPDLTGNVDTPTAVLTVNGVAPDVDGDVETPTGITLLPEGTQPPLGSPPGLYGFIPSSPTPPAFESVSYDTLGTQIVCPIPGSVAVGDVVIFIPGFVPTTTTVNNITCPNAGWVELFDYSANQSRKSAVYVYQVIDATALANLGSAVTANNTDAARRGGLTYVIPGSLVASAWPAYGSGSNRSAATINSNTTTGCSIQGFSTATVPFHKVVLYTLHDANAAPAASAGFTDVGWATGSSGGAVPFTLSLMVKDLSATPIPAATVTHPTADTSTHGGGQFIVPVA